MTSLHAAGLGLAQGLGEFLPISSSGHLVLIPWLLGWQYQGKALDVALHLGTLVAVFAYFWKDWVGLVKAGLGGRPSPQKRLFWLIVLATIPGGLAGLFLEKRVETIFHSPITISLALAGFGLLLGACDRWGRQLKHIADLDFRSALIIGLAQALAIAPGVSRSGITITAALWLGFRRAEAARFSFLLSAPIIAAAGILSLRHLQAEALTAPFWLGILTAAVTGLAAIHFLLSYLKTRGVELFVIYRVAFALFCLAWAWR